MDFRNRKIQEMSKVERRALGELFRVTASVPYTSCGVAFRGWSKLRILN